MTETSNILEDKDTSYQSHNGVIASKPRRILSCAVDYLLLVITRNLLWYDSFVGYPDNVVSLRFNLSEIGSCIIFTLYVFFGSLYFGGTLGQKLFRIRIVSVSECKIKMKTAFIRSFFCCGIYLVPITASALTAYHIGKNGGVGVNFPLFSLGYLCFNFVFFLYSKSNQTIQDAIAETVVVYLEGSKVRQ